MAKPMKPTKANEHRANQASNECALPKVLGGTLNEYVTFQGRDFEFLFWHAILTDELVQSGVAMWQKDSGEYMGLGFKPKLEMAIVWDALDVNAICQQLETYLTDHLDNYPPGLGLETLG